MKQKSKRGAPRKNGILKLVPCRFENISQWRQVLKVLTIEQRAMILFEKSKQI